MQNYSGYSSFSDNANIDRNNVTWRVFDVKAGKIRLISNNSTSKHLGLYGYDGYNNGVYLIDEACDVLYSSNIGKAINLKIEDVEKYLTIDYKEYVSTSSEAFGDEKEYINNNLYYPNIIVNEKGCKGIDGTSGTDNITGILALSEQTELIEGKSKASSRLKLTQTFWTKTLEEEDFIDPIYYSIFVHKKVNSTSWDYYWISSRNVDLWNGYALFGVYGLNNTLGRVVTYRSNDDMGNKNSTRITSSCFS